MCRTLTTPFAYACLLCLWSHGAQAQGAGTEPLRQLFEGLYGDPEVGPGSLPMLAASQHLQLSPGGLTAGVGVSIAPLPHLAIETDAGIDTAAHAAPDGRRGNRVGSLLRPQLQFADSDLGTWGVALGVGVERRQHARIRDRDQPRRTRRSWWFRNELSVLFAHRSGSFVGTSIGVRSPVKDAAHSSPVRTPSATLHTNHRGHLPHLRCFLGWGFGRAAR
jgi:hypothetical protein